MKILLLGASGFAGGALWQRLSGRHHVVGTRMNGDVPQLVRLDLRDEPALRELASRHWDLVIHAAGLVELGAAEAAPDLAWKLNVRSVEILVDVLETAGAKLVYISSDNVFDGTAQVYHESDPPSPVNVYGQTKVAAERVVLSDPRHLVLRIPILYGRSPWSNKFLDRYTAATTEAQTDIVCTPLYLPSFAFGVEELWERAGLLHYAGRETVTRFELMTTVQRALRLDSRVVPVREEDLVARYRRPKRLVLRSERQPLEGPDLSTALGHWVGGVTAAPPI
jgi:dTDP-4-dehydrorhamnose reductase